MTLDTRAVATELERLQLIERAAQYVVDNAYGTKARHTRDRAGGCRDDCQPCSMDNLRDAIGGYSWDRKD